MFLMNVPCKNDNDLDIMLFQATQVVIRDNHLNVQKEKLSQRAERLSQKALARHWEDCKYMNVCSIRWQQELLRDKAYPKEIQLLQGSVAFLFPELPEIFAVDLKKDLQRHILNSSKVTRVIQRESRFAILNDS